MRSFFFRNDGIVLYRSVRSRERTIVHQERRPALVAVAVCVMEFYRKTNYRKLAIHSTVNRQTVLSIVLNLKSEVFKL